MDTAVRARAEQAGIDLKEINDRVEAYVGGKCIGFGVDAETVLAKAMSRLGGIKAPEEPKVVGETPVTHTGKAEEPRTGRTGKAKKLTRKQVSEAKEATVADKPKKAAPKKAATKKAAAKKPVVAKEAKASEPGQMSGSIIKARYKDKYKKHGGSCGDPLSIKLKAYLTGPDAGKNASIDLTKLRKVAQDNGVWKDEYIALSVGQQRMTIGNRLRNKLAKGELVVVGDVKFKPK